MNFKLTTAMKANFSQSMLFRQEQVQLIPFVATDLRMVELTASEANQRDAAINGVTYRRLDAQYFVWIERQMDRAEKARVAGKLSAVALTILQERFAPIKSWVAENLDQHSIEAARKLFATAGYEPPKSAQSKPVLQPNGEHHQLGRQQPIHQELPSVYLYPPDGNWEYTAKVDPGAVKLIDAIRDEALSKGWTMATLYQNRGHFIAGKWYGLICVLDSTDVIVSVEPEFITIRTFKGSAIPPEGEIVQFPNLRWEK